MSPGPQHGARGTRSLVTSPECFGQATMEGGGRIQDLSFLKAKVLPAEGIMIVHSLSVSYVHGPRVAQQPTDFHSQY